MNPARPTALLVVISGPSGTGKTTLCDRLVEEFATMSYSVSCTTRSPREGEIDGEDYHFLDSDQFDEQVSAGDFLEYAEVFGCMYGTLRRTVYDCLEAGRDVLMDIDVQGAEQIRRYVDGVSAEDPLRQALVEVFIAPPSLQALEDRLRGRGKDARDIIERRLQKAEEEMSRSEDYQYLVVNDTLDTSYEVLRSIIVAEHHRLRRETRR